MQRLKDKIALVTGGTSGIGLATATRFVAEGATVIITGRHEATVKETIQQLGEQTFGIVCDATSLEDISGLKERIATIAPAIDILFLNAGYGRFAPVESVDAVQFDELFDVLVKGTFFTAQAVLPMVREGGSVIFNTSVVTLYGSPYASVYSAAKAAVASFVKTFAAEYVAKGIRVNGISPGYTATRGFEKTGMSADQIEEVVQSVLPVLPFKRFAKAEEIAHAAVFLASDEASYIHGTELVVDGGFTAIR